MGHKEEYFFSLSSYQTICGISKHITNSFAAHHIQTPQSYGNFIHNHNHSGTYPISRIIPHVTEINLFIFSLRTSHSRMRRK